MLSYKQIYNRFRGLVTAPELATLEPDDLQEVLLEYLQGAVYMPKLQVLFSFLSLDDDGGAITYSLKYPSNIDGADDMFIRELLATGMAINWYKPKIDSVLNIGMAIGGKEEKVLKNNYKANIERLNMLQNSFDKMIRDHGYAHNGYLEGSDV